ncbi:BamA/TamA family outer membrane protein [Pseudoalteromonas sp. SIMBA_148]
MGIGVRWVSPIGPIRVDLARSLSDPDEGYKIHFSMGPEL